MTDSEKKAAYLAFMSSALCGIAGSTEIDGDDEDESEEAVDAGIELAACYADRALESYMETFNEKRKRRSREDD